MLRRLPLLALAFLATLALAATILPQTPSAPSAPPGAPPLTAGSNTTQAALKPSEVQSLKLQNLQLKARLAQAAMQQAQQQFSEALSALNTEAESVKKENGWPAETQFDGNTLAFVAPPATPPVAAPTTPAVKKP